MQRTHILRHYTDEEKQLNALTHCLANDSQINSIRANAEQPLEPQHPEGGGGVLKCLKWPLWDPFLAFCKVAAS